jgi:hypothetical protein
MLDILKPVRIAAMVAALLALTVALTAGVLALLSSVQQTLPPEFTFALALMPANTYACLMAVLSAAGIRWVYDTHAKILFSIGGG